MTGTTWLLLPLICLLALACSGDKSPQPRLAESPTASEPEQMVYTNDENGYRIQYPSDWTIEASSTTCQARDFCQQTTELKHPEGGQVYIVVNFQGGWCEGLIPPQVSDIQVSGQSGKEYVCPGFTIRSFGEGASIIRFFRDVGGKNYFILGQAHRDLGPVTKIVRSFEFTYSVHPDGTHTGVPQIDRFLDIAYAGNLASLADDAVFTPVPCSPPRGPIPQCTHEAAQGIPMPILLFASCTPAYVIDRAELKDRLQLFSITRPHLYAVFETTPEASFRMDAALGSSWLLRRLRLVPRCQPSTLTVRGYSQAS